MSNPGLLDKHDKSCWTLDKHIIQQRFFNSSFTDFSPIKLPSESQIILFLVTTGHRTGYSMRMRISHKLKMQENIVSMPLTILVGDFQPCMQWNIIILQLMHVHM